MTVCFNIHDEIMVENIQSQVAVQSELENMDSGKKYMLEERAKKYLDVRTILLDEDNIDIGASSIKVSEPEKMFTNPENERTAAFLNAVL